MDRDEILRVIKMAAWKVVKSAEPSSGEEYEVDGVALEELEDILNMHPGFDSWNPVEHKDEVYDWLCKNGPASCPELAREFHVSIAKMYRSLCMLRANGVVRLGVGGWTSA